MAAVSTSPGCSEVTEVIQKPHDSKKNSSNISYSRVPAHIDDEIAPSNSTSGAFTGSGPLPWVPFTLRKPFLAFMTALSLALCALVSILTAVSHQRVGLGNDDGTDIVLFGWRYSPTVIAVIYAHLVNMVFNDFQRTEPFAKLATSTVPAASSVLQAPQTWWKLLARALSPKKNQGSVNWTLAGVTSIYVLASLVISSLSSSFLRTQESPIVEAVSLEKMVPAITPIALKIEPDTFLRSTSNLIYNLSTSPWNIGPYTVLPFWPESSNQDDFMSLSSSNITKSWTGVTSVFDTKYMCQSMKIATTFNNTMTFSEWATRSERRNPLTTMVVVNGTSKMDSILLSSNDGCQYQTDVAPTLMLNRVNSVAWGRASDSLYRVGFSWSDVHSPSPDINGWIYIPFNETANETTTNTFFSLERDVGPQSPFVRYNSSGSCERTDIVLMGTVLFTDADEPFMSNYTQRAWSCELEVDTADVPVTITMAENTFNVTFSHGDFDQNRSRLTDDTMNLTEVRRLLHQSEWLSYLSPATFLSDRSALLLTAEYDYDFAKMLEDDDMPAKLQNTTQAFFAELLQSAFAQDGTWLTKTIDGETTVQAKRVKVLHGVGIALALIFGFNACLLAILTRQCLPANRPLNLTTNPSTTEGVADLVIGGHWDRESWKALFISSKEEVQRSFAHKSYTTSPKLQECDNGTGFLTALPEHDQELNRSVHDWKPTTLRNASLLSLGVYLALFATAIAILSTYASDNQLWRETFIYEVDVELRDSVARFTPFSIVPTLLAVIVAMWWDAIHHKFCQLQPFIAMTKPEGSKYEEGVGLYYNGTNWIKTAYRAAMNGHWLLWFAVMSNFLCQLLTISSSALFERELGVISSSITLPRSLELRELPIRRESRGMYNQDTTFLKEVDREIDELSLQELEYAFTAHEKTYWASPTTWLYGATNQIIRNGSEPNWSLAGWNFMPIDLMESTDLDNQTEFKVSTPALKARLDCSPTIEGYDLRNISSWLVTYDLTNTSVWNTSANPQNLDKAYWFRQLPAYGTPYQETYPFCPPTGDTVTTMTGAMWNDFSGDAPGRFPYRFSQWPINFTATWVYGTARSDFLTIDNVGENMTKFDENVFPNTGCDINRDVRFNLSMWTEIPAMQSMSCRPVIEEADASVTVNLGGRVSKFELMSEPKAIKEPWQDVFVTYSRNSSDGDNTFPTQNNDQYRNSTSSYGIYFLSSLLKAPATVNVDTDNTTKWDFGLLYPDADGTKKSSGIPFASYFIHDEEKQLSADLMSYCVYTLANKDSKALATNTTLFTSLIDSTFQTFFQHFISGTQPSESAGGRWGFQDIGAEMPDLGSRILYSQSAGMLQKGDAITYPDQKTTRIIEGVVERQVELLKMNAVATWLAFSILVILLLISIAIMLLQRQHLSSLKRDVECLADIMVMIAGSEHFLQLVEERSVQGMRDDQDLRLKLGWFREECGTLRWGIEVSGGEKSGDVVWVEKERDIGVIGERISTGLVESLSKK